MRVLVLGAGYAGLTLARRLEDRLPAAADLLVVDETGDHLVQHELHRVVRQPEVADAIRIPLSESLSRAEVIAERVESVDRGERTVTLAGGDRIEYDYAAVCLGAETDFHGLPGVEDHATPLKRLAHARRIRESFLEVCRDGGRVVVAGAGLSGVQVAGELAALARETVGAGESDGRGSSRDAADSDGRDCRASTATREALESAGVELVLLERLDAVAPSFPANFQGAVREALETRGVDVRTGRAVERASASGVELDDGRIGCDQLVWTGGITGSGALDHERPVVRGDLRLDARAFAVGDAARVVDADGEAVPASAAAATREARTAATNVARLVEDDLAGDGGFEPRMEPYRFDVPGWLVSVGDGAVAQLGATVLTGAAARALKATVGAGYLGSVGAIREAVDLVESELT